MESRSYSPKEFGRLIGRSTKTLQRWDREGILKARRTPTDRRYYAVDLRLEDIGSGLNYKRKHFVELMQRVERNEIAEIIIAHKDRLVRFGFEWFEDFCQSHGTTALPALRPAQVQEKDRPDGQGGGGEIGA